jgi:hypothetical protein
MKYSHLSLKKKKKKTIFLKVLKKKNLLFSTLSEKPKHVEITDVFLASRK